MQSSIAIGLIGGSGLYQLEPLTGRREHAIATPFGATSDLIVTGELHPHHLVCRWFFLRRSNVNS